MSAKKVYPKAIVSLINRGFKTCLLSVLFLFFGLNLEAKPLENENMFKYEYLDFEQAKISLLTCGPGNELYSIFGHTAIRVKDPVKNIDAVFNFGTFEFDEDFYKNYIMGRLNYCLTYSSFPDFMYSYSMEGREVRELTLNLNVIQTQAFFQWLRRTYLGEERCYLYDFLYDNCTTKPRDFTDNWPHKYKNINPVNPEDRVSFRKQLHEYLTYFPWSGLGIDILLGLPLDKKPNYSESAFLPDLLEAYYQNKHIKEEDFVKGPPKVLLNNKIERPGAIRYLYHPVTWFWIVFGFLALVTLLNPAAKITALINNLILFVLGLLGFFLLFMWFGTDHAATKANFNLAWANPFFILIPFFKLESTIKKSLTWFMIAGGFFTTFGFILSPQQFNAALLPLFIWLLIGGVKKLFYKP
jgi:hypothetical protein